MHPARSPSLVALALAFAVGAGGGACGSDDVFLNERIFEVKAEGLERRGAGCAAVSFGRWNGGSSSGGGPVDGDFAVAQRSDGGGVTVTVTSQAEALAQRRFDEPFLRSGRVEELTVQTKGGRTLLLRYWGGPCTPLEAASP